MYNITPLNLYKKLYDGECIEFDLLEGGKHCGFKFEKDFSVRSYNPKVIKKQKIDNKITFYEHSEFTRKIQLPEKVERIKIE